MRCRCGRNVTVVLVSLVPSQYVDRRGDFEDLVSALKGILFVDEEENVWKTLTCKISWNASIITTFGDKTQCVF